MVFLPALREILNKKTLKNKIFGMKNLGIVLAAIGLIMMIYTGFNYVTKEKVVDIGPLQINKETNHPVQWSPIVGAILLVGGIVVIVTSKNAKA
jgi:uncharacterized membrane protein YdcZ (DUF606 family)